MLEFPPLDDRRISFSLTINDCPLLGPNNPHHADLHSFWAKP